MDADALPYTCRGCLAVETKAILHSLENDAVRELFVKCTSVQVDLDENMPLQICSLCFGRCENWESFRSRVQANEEELRRNLYQFVWDSETYQETREEKVEVEHPATREKMTFIVHPVDALADEDAEEEVGEEEEESRQSFELKLNEEESGHDDDEEIHEPDNEPTNSLSSESPRSQTYMCEECGECIKGILTYRKHKFQHEMNLKKRVRDTRNMVAKVKEINGADLVQQEEEKLLVKSWTHKNRKQMRNSGEAYINSGAALVNKKGVRPIDCRTCPWKCNQTISEKEREKLNRKYWAMDYGAKRLFLHDMVLERKCQRTSKAHSRRQYTLEYTLNGNRVCKKFFCATLDITDRIVLHCKTKARLNVDVTTDFRGLKGYRKPKKAEARE